MFFKLLTNVSLQSSTCCVPDQSSIQIFNILIFVIALVYFFCVFANRLWCAPKIDLIRYGTSGSSFFLKCSALTPFRNLHAHFDLRKVEPKAETTTYSNCLTIYIRAAEKIVLRHFEEENRKTIRLCLLLILEVAQFRRRFSLLEIGSLFYFFKCRSNPFGHI